MLGQISVDRHIQKIMTTYCTLNFDVYIILQMNVNHVVFKIPFLENLHVPKKRSLTKEEIKKRTEK